MKKFLRPIPITVAAVTAALTGILWGPLTSPVTISVGQVLCLAFLSCALGMLIPKRIFSE